MDYKKKYENALEWARQVINGECGFIRKDVEEVFPELKESEGERIRKGMLQGFKDYGEPEYVWWEGVKVKECIAWLEKQGEQEFADKVEPKFGIGDYLVNDYCKGKVIALTDNAYLLDTGQGMPFSCEHNIHLWTINDAKDGDVLAFKNNIGGIIICKSPTYYDTRSYCRLVSDNLIHKEESGWDSTLLVPATKEQHDRLGKAITEAGYEWNAEKKELKKIHVIDEGKAEMDYCFTKMMNGEKVSPTWSEEDEKIYQSIIDDTVQENQLDDKQINWLKSLKQRMQLRNQK